MSRRVAATVAILAAVAALAIACLAFGDEFPRGLAVPLCVAGAVVLAWFALLRRGGIRLAGMILAALLLGLAVGMLISGGRVLELALVFIFSAIAVAGARAAFTPEHSLSRRPAPRRPVLFINPRSGDGKAGEYELAAEAAKRGIETVELGPGDDLADLVQKAIDAGSRRTGDGRRGRLSGDSRGPRRGT